ncbi:microtubule-associated serine/threonine-protein kinase 3-like [Ornithodoros turicata]|uniref:microtubule-associated serine/threonine-protein kinase 3-like n=1 Tax=Ornithodoros turicata TaxID=34597 RepID=UPI00313960A3
MTRGAAKGRRLSLSTTTDRSVPSTEQTSTKSSTEEDGLNRRDSLRKKKNAAVKVLVSLFPRIPKVTTVLLEFFIKQENKLSLQRDPLSHFCHDQCVLEAQDCLQKLHRLYITYQDVRDMIENLVRLHALCEKRDPAVACELGTVVRKLTIIVSELGTSLEKISEVTVTDWMAVGNAVTAKQGKKKSEKPLFTDFIPKVHELEEIKLLGAGGFGAVYKARYKPANLICTVKLVASDRFRRQQQACVDKVVHSIVRSPYLVRYYACFVTKEAYVTIMEYICGVDLMRVVERATFLSVDQVQIIMAQLILAVEHLHFKGFLHRDIKISNMLLLPGGRVKVIDFDTCKMCLGHFTRRAMKGYFRRTPFEFRDGESAGTVPYMAPEILKRRPYGRAIDWWSTGIVFYKLMTGRVPFRGKNKRLLRERIMCGRLKWPNPNENPHSATPVAKDMVHKLLKKNPRDRLGSRVYRDLKSHSFFDGFVWSKLQQSKELCYIPALFEVLQDGGSTRDEDEDARESEGSQDNLSPHATTWTRNRKLPQIEDMTDIDKSAHRPLLTYASTAFKRVVTMVNESEGTVTVDESIMAATNTSTADLDYETAPDADSGLAGLTLLTSGSNSDLKSRRASEQMDVIIFRKKSFGRYWGFGVNLEHVTGEGGRRFYMVESVKTGSPAQRSQVLEGDVVVAVNGTKVSSLPIRTVRKLMNSSGDQLVLTVLSSSPYRIINTRQDVVSVLRYCGQESMTLGLEKWGCRGEGSFGFTTRESKAWDQRKKSFFRVHIVQEVNNVSILTRNRQLYPGDILLEVDGKAAEKMNHVALQQAISQVGPELQITIAPLSPLRRKRPSSTRFQETFLSDYSVAEPSSAGELS